MQHIWRKCTDKSLFLKNTKSHYAILLFLSPLCVLRNDKTRGEDDLTLPEEGCWVADAVQLGIVGGCVGDWARFTS